MPDAAHDPDEAARAFGRALRERSTEIAREWLERLLARIQLDKRDVFPTEDFLDHVPLLINSLARHVEHPEDGILEDARPMDEAIDLAELRLSQGFEATELLREYDDLRQILYEVYVDVLERADAAIPGADGILAYHQLLGALAALERTTAHRFLSLQKKAVERNEKALRSFNRAVSHELKNRIGVIQNAWLLIHEHELGPDQERRERLERMLTAGIMDLKGVVDNMIMLSRTSAGHVDARRTVSLPDAVDAAFRLLRDLADVRGVELVKADDLADARVPAALVEVCLFNLVSNGIKYSDPAKPRRWVEVGARRVEAEGGGHEELVVEVRDNGIGIPDEFRVHLFEQFSRQAEDPSGIEGTGLGLSIVRETAESIGARVWVEFPTEGGTTFFLALPVDTGIRE